MSSEAEKEAQLAELLNVAWREYRDEIRERVEAVRVAITEAAGGRLEESKRAEANSAVHKLAGALGTFGMREASRASLQIEAMLAPGAPLGQEQAADFQKQFAVIADSVEARDRQSKA